MESILETLETADPKTLTPQFASILKPFSDFTPLDASTNPNSHSKKKLQITSTSIRPLAKKFLPFLSKSLKLIPNLLRRNPSSQSPIEDERATELLKIYRLAIDCLSCISVCLVGNPNFIDLEWGGFVYCLEVWGKYEEAEKEGVLLIGKLGIEKGEGLEPEILMLAAKVVSCVLGCAYKRKLKDGSVYKRNLQLVEQLLPLLRVLDTESMGKYHTLIVTALCRCALFLAEECISFDSNLVREFCQKTLTECLQSSSTDRFQNVPRNICKSIDKSWESRPFLIHDMLNITLKSFMCECKVGLVKAVNEFLEFVLYCSKSLSSISMDICCSDLLYNYGGDFLQVSPPVASILFLYATGLYLKLSDIESTGASPILFFIDNVEKQQILTDSLGALAKYFYISSYSNKVFFKPEVKESDSSFEVLESAKNKSSKHVHGNVSMSSYLDALEYLCLLLVEYTNPMWEYFVSQDRAACHSNGINYVLDALHQFCDFILAAFKCTKTSERGQERLHESRKTMLQVAVSALKISLRDPESHKKSFTYFESIISSAWIEPSELKYFISALGNVGASLYNTRQLAQASIVLELRCKTILTHVKLLCKMYSEKPNGSHSDYISKDEIRTVLVDAFEMCAVIVDVLHKCHASNVYKITVKSLVELSAGEDMFPNLSGSLALAKQWVKMLCKDFENVDGLEKVPYLYSLLLSHCSTLSKKILGKILEQELLAYGLMEARNPDLCQKMQLKVIDTLLNDVLTTEEYYVQRSRILIRKGRALRACGIEGLNDCIKCLRDAITLLKEISGNLSIKNAPIYNQLALVYILAAQCTQEANQEREVILQDVRNALELRSSIGIQGIQGQYPENDYFELPATNTIRLLCSIVDLLSMKGCWELQFGICKLIFKIFKCENVPVEKCLAMLWSERRINHSLCSSPINEDSILEISQHLDSHANSVECWITCLKDCPSFLLAFTQKLSLSDSILPEVNRYSSGRDIGSIAVDEVKRVASSLISDIPLSSQSASIAGYLYYDLSERLMSDGQLFEALSHARVALWLRRKLLQRKFFYSFEHKFAEPVQMADASQNLQDTVCLGIIGSVATELWPDTCKSSGLENSILTPWSVLRCYLESILQVGIINESIGNGAEAEVLFLTGKSISSMQDLPIFQIAFTSLLGQLYRKNQFWDLAENELNCARNLLQENDMIISCKRCKLAFDVFVDMQFGDLSRIHRKSGDPVQLSSHALQVYRKALDKLNHDELESSLNCCRKAETCRIDMQDAQYGVLNAGKKPSTQGEVRFPVCTICSSTHNGDVHHAKQAHQENMNDKGLNLNKGTRKSSRFPSNCPANKRDLNAELKSKTRSSKRTTHNKSASVTDRVDINDVRIADCDICPDNLGRRNSQLKVKGYSTDFGCDEECTSNTIKCWRCFLIKSMVDGSMQNIIYLKWECRRRRLLMRLLLKIAKCQGIHCGKNKAHEVHDKFWQCTSVMFNQHPTSRSNSDFSDLYLIELTRGEDSRDIFPVEKASLLYNMSWFFLKDCHSENFRMKCCTLSHIQARDVVPWLLRAFILSRELPLLFQKVSKLLSSIYLISTVDGPIPETFSSKSSLSTSHWAVFFHQASLGTYLPCQYLACLKDKACFPKVSEDPCAIMLDAVIKESNFLRFAPDRLENLEEFVREFFQSLPSVPVLCISFLEGDYANLIGETLLLPSFLPAWMLLSRLNAANQPIAMLLPVDRILEEVQLESVKEWQCPWSYSVVDYVAPVFKQLLKENFLSSNKAYTGMDTKMNNINWWSQRSNLNNCLNKLIKSMEDLWLGPWACLLLGECSNPDYRSKIIPKLINELKLQCEVEANDSLVSAILGGSNSIADMEACIAQLLLYRGYFGRGACCGEERLRAFSTACPNETRSLPDSVYRLLLEVTGQIAKPSNREPVILVLDSDVQMLPWENLPTLRSQEVYRMPSVASISLTLRRCSYYQKHNKGVGFPFVNPSDTYYLLNPSGDLGSTQVEFEQWFRNQNWEGEAGKVPSAEELALALKNHDLFLYFGHGTGMQYIPGKEIQKLNKCAAALLMGCSSGAFTYKGCYAPRGAPLSYLFAGSPVVIANLWEVTDKDIDRFGKSMLKSWLEEESSVAVENCTRCNQLEREFGCLEIDSGSITVPKTRSKASSKKLQNLNDKGRCMVCGPKRIASFMSQAREACKLPFLIGAAPVCYGVPTIIIKKA